MVELDETCIAFCQTKCEFGQIDWATNERNFQAVRADRKGKPHH
jgi:hypothetical protein